MRLADAGRARQLRQRVIRDRAVAGDGNGNLALGETALTWVRRGDALQLAHNLSGLTLAEGDRRAIRRYGDLASDLWYLEGRPGGCPTFAFVYHIAGNYPTDGSADELGGDPLLFNFGSFGTGGVAVHPNQADHYYISNQTDRRVYKVIGGAITAFAGTGVSSSSITGIGGPATAAQLTSSVFGLAVAPDGRVFIGVWSANNFQGGAILTVDPATGNLVRLAGTATAGFSGDGGQSQNAQITTPWALRYHDGSLYFCDSGNVRVRKIDPPFDGTGTISTVVNMGAISAGASDIAWDRQDRMYIVDATGAKIYRWDGATTTLFAGGGSDSGEGVPPLSASIAPMSIVIDACDVLYFGDNNVNRVRKIDLALPFVYSLTAGGFGAPVPSPQALASATFFANYFMMDIDSAGRLSVADYGNDAIRRIGP